jgi:hypothetical protein
MHPYDWIFNQLDSPIKQLCYEFIHITTVSGLAWMRFGRESMHP